MNEESLKCSEKNSVAPRTSWLRAMLLPVFLWLPLALLALSGCKYAADSDDQPLNFWADVRNDAGYPCIAATAQAILKSGLPYPHVEGEEIIKFDGTKGIRAKTVDVWVGSTRFVLPAKLVGDDGGYGRNHPRKYWKLGGSLPHFYPVGAPGPEVDGMGSMVAINISCSVDTDYVASWGKGYRSNADGILKVKEQYEARLRDDPARSGKVTVSVRKDIGMTEVLLEYVRIHPDGQPIWEASYWPLKTELKGPDGDISGIGCTTRHDPQKRYGGRGWRCSSSMGLTPEASISIEIYVSQIEHMPAIYGQIKQLFMSAKQN